MTTFDAFILGVIFGAAGAAFVLLVGHAAFGPDDDL